MTTLENNDYNVPPASVPYSVGSRSGVSIDARRALRDEAVTIDEATTAEVALALLWRELARGAWRIVDSFFTKTRCYVMTARAEPASTPLLEGRRLEILEGVLCGLGQKNIAFDLGLATSTVAFNARLGLETLGIVCKPSRVHPLLMLAAKAAQDHTLALTGSLSVIHSGWAPLRVISVRRPERCLAGVLPRAELAVVRSLVEGHSYADVARQRGTSPRTIANQIAAVFRRMGVSGRSELVHRLFAESSSSDPTRQPLTVSDWEPLRKAAG